MGSQRNAQLDEASEADCNATAEPAVGVNAQFGPNMIDIPRRSIDTTTTTTGTTTDATDAGQRSQQGHSRLCCLRNEDHEQAPNTTARLLGGRAARRGREEEEVEQTNGGSSCRPGSRRVGASNERPPLSAADEPSRPAPSGQCELLNRAVSSASLDCPKRRRGISQLVAHKTETFRRRPSSWLREEEEAREGREEVKLRRQKQQQQQKPRSATTTDAFASPHDSYNAAAVAADDDEKMRRRCRDQRKSARRLAVDCRRQQANAATAAAHSSTTAPLVLLLLLLISNCLAILILNLPPAVEAASDSSAARANLYHSLSHHHHHDDESDLPPLAQRSPPPAGDAGDSSSGAGSGDNLTEIPYDDDDQHSNGKPTPYTQATTTTTSTTTTRRPMAVKRTPAVLRVTETELLPFAEFNVQQPAFSDLIKSWPPTTQQAAANLAAAGDHSGSGGRVRIGPGGASRYQRPGAAGGSVGSYGGGQLRGHHQDAYDQDGQSLSRNHLNEDLDDTMVTADQGFERDQLPEPPTWVNYLGDLGDYIYVQLRQYMERNGNSVSGAGGPSSQQQQQPSQPAQDNDSSSSSSTSQQQQQRPPQGAKIDTIDELLDDFYYDQYENSQVLYYGAQLVREGDIFEIGCYMPSDQQAEWTKSGRPLPNKASSPRVVRRSDFLGAKQNYSLKIFEASLSDSGNYRCNKMSRKYHKLVVVPLKTTTNQLYVIQQRLLAVVNPRLSTAPFLTAAGARGNAYQQQQQQPQRFHAASRQSNPARRDYLLPGYLIVESQPLAVTCNITDEFVLRRLRENPQFHLAWYKNGKQLRAPVQAGGPLALPWQQSNGQSRGLTQQQQQQSSGRARQQSAVVASSSSAASMGGPVASAAGYSRPNSQFNQRIQFLQPNGRQLFITSAQYGDAGDYLCSWSKLPTRQSADETEDAASGGGGGSGGEYFAPADDGQANSNLAPTIASNPLAAGSLFQLMAPVKLRPFKSTYHVRQGNELRLACQAQRGYPHAHISWYVGNRLVDGEFLREHADEFRVLQLHGQNQLVVTSPTNGGGGGGSGNNGAGSGQDSSDDGADKRQIVEINPVPSGRQQMQLTTNGRGLWIEYRDLKNERYAIETPEQQLRYLQMKLGQLSGSNHAANQAGGSSSSSSRADGDLVPAMFSQSSVSVLIINSLNIERHTSRYACRATTRANTDEVTTVIRVQASSTVVSRPSTGRATLVPGQPLYLECSMVDSKDPKYSGFRWYKRGVNQPESEPITPVEPGLDDFITIHNAKLTLLKPTSQLQGDYICRALDKDNKEYPAESAVIKVRTQPYIEDFGLDTSHTGKSTTITDGDRLELICTVRDTSGPVNITWLRSATSDDDRTMVPLPETPKTSAVTTQSPHDLLAQTYIAPDQNIIIESLGTHSKKLIIESIRHEHRSYYVCMADNGITERTRKIIFIRVKDKLVALWPFLGIVAELFILFTIIHVWETQRAYKEIHATPPSAPATGATSNKRPASGASGAFESVPLTSG